jgi:hypothetical protein
LKLKKPNRTQTEKNWKKNQANPEKTQAKLKKPSQTKRKWF